jgi:hypothetical protein
MELDTLPIDRDYPRPCGRRAIADNPGSYVKYVAYGMTLFLSFLFPMPAIVFLVIPVAGIIRGGLLLSYATIVMIMVHLAMGLLTAAYEAL